MLVNTPDVILTKLLFAVTPTNTGLFAIPEYVMNSLPSAEPVQLENRKPVTMLELQIGDKIQGR